MDIFIDDNIGTDEFFISVPLDERDLLSFDWTTKGHRVILQRLERMGVAVVGEKPASEWDTLHIKNGEFIGKEHVVWYGMGQEDWINGDVYAAIHEWPLDEITAKELLRYSLLVREHIAGLEFYAQEMRAFERLLEELKQKHEL